MIGPGKYDDICTRLREDLKADGVILVVCNGEHGNGFSAQLPDDLVAGMPSVLRQIADQMDEDFRKDSNE